MKVPSGREPPEPDVDEGPEEEEGKPEQREPDPAQEDAERVDHATGLAPHRQAAGRPPGRKTEERGAAEGDEPADENDQAALVRGQPGPGHADQDDEEAEDEQARNPRRDPAVSRPGTGARSGQGATDDRHEARLAPVSAVRTSLREPPSR